MLVTLCFDKLSKSTAVEGNHTHFNKLIRIENRLKMITIRYDEQRRTRWGWNGRQISFKRSNRTQDRIRNIKGVT